MDFGLVQNRPTAYHWSVLGTRDRLGVQVPVSSLRSSTSQGVGDATDLRRLVSLCADVGISLVQVLPLNDMGRDKAPYSSISAFALDPIYIDLFSAEVVTGNRELEDAAKRLRDAAEGSPRVDFGRVRDGKLRILARGLEKSLGGPRQQMESFLSDNEEWLHDYLLFRVAKDSFGFRSWENWPADMRRRAALERLAQDRQELYQLHLYCQWELARQFLEARREADRLGVALCGDVPILVSRDSADVFWHPEWFNLDLSVGAPPDMFARDGQNWGFPPYDWERLWADGCAFWRDRLRFCESFYHVYRIDHVIGFFRLWVVRREEQTGRNGWFVPADEASWEEHGKSILRLLLDSTSMLPIAEDLGTVPPVCRKVLREFGICGMKVQRWERRWEGDGGFIPPSQYPPVSVATFSTHDSETLPGWWEANPEDSSRLYREVFGRDDAPSHLSPELHRWFLRWLGEAPSVFYILLLQEFLYPLGLLPGNSTDHRINVPGTTLESNWTWRSPALIEELGEHEGFFELVEEVGGRRVVRESSGR